MPTKDIANDTIVSKLREAICRSVTLFEQGKDRYRVLTPFAFPDGDRFCPILMKTGSKWSFTDDGSTFMRITYRINDDSILAGTRGKVIEQAIQSFGLSNTGGVLSIPVTDADFGSALYGFTQAILRISDVALWNKHNPKSSFAEEFKKTIKEAVAAQNEYQFNWSDKLLDPKQVYPVDCRISARVPLFIFGVHNEAKCDSATIVIQHYRKKIDRFNTVVIYESQEEIGRKNVARLTDVADKQFASLPTAVDLKGYL